MVKCRMDFPSRKYLLQFPGGPTVLVCFLSSLGPHLLAVLPLLPHAHPLSDKEGCSCSICQGRQRACSFSFTRAALINGLMGGQPTLVACPLDKEVWLIIKET